MLNYQRVIGSNCGWFSVASHLNLLRSRHCRHRMTLQSASYSESEPGARWWPDRSPRKCIWWRNHFFRMKRRSPWDGFWFELFCRRRFFDTSLALLGDPPSTVTPCFFGTHRVTVARSGAPWGWQVFWFRSCVCIAGVASEWKSDGAQLDPLKQRDFLIQLNLQDQAARIKCVTAMCIMEIGSSRWGICKTESEG